MAMNALRFAFFKITLFLSNMSLYIYIKTFHRTALFLKIILTLIAKTVAGIEKINVYHAPHNKNKIVNTIEHFTIKLVLVGVFSCR